MAHLWWGKNDREFCQHQNWGEIFLYIKPIIWSKTRKCYHPQEKYEYIENNLKNFNSKKIAWVWKVHFEKTCWIWIRIQFSMAKLVLVCFTLTQLFKRALYVYSQTKISSMHFWKSSKYLNLYQLYPDTKYFETSKIFEWLSHITQQLA